MPNIYFFLSLDDVLQAISAAVNNNEEFPLTVSRSHVVDRGLAQWKRQKKALPTSRLKIRFIGEAGLDTGALRKEFLTGTHIFEQEKHLESTDLSQATRISRHCIILSTFLQPITNKIESSVPFPIIDIS